MIVFSSSATRSKVSFDAVNKEWDVTMPVSGSDEIFLSGLAFPVPAAGLPMSSFENGCLKYRSHFWNSKLD